MSGPGNGGDGNSKRNLPSWMSSRGSGSKPDRKKPANSGESASESATSSFSKLLDGVVFVLSGFVNPERSELRSQALEMGAEFQQDWNSESTLLICAFQNTPKFRQVEADCGTIVSKEWITECYNHKKLVPIETYLMNVGKPWRKNKCPPDPEINQGNETTPISEPTKQTNRSSNSKPSVSVPSKDKSPSPVKGNLSPMNVKKWALEDLNKTISWLESQDERPDPSEVRKIAAEGILTCLQDAIESLEQNQDIQQVTEQWRYIPRVVEELTRNGSSTLLRKDLCEQAISCKRIYELEFGNLDDDSNKKKKKQKHTEDIRNDDKITKDTSYDSDETIEMTEDEVDHAYKTIASRIGEW